MSFGFVLLIIEVIITSYLMIELMGIIYDLPGGHIKVALLRLLTSAPVSFVVNLAISSMMTWFTGEGLTAGFANLGSSVLVGFFLPVYLKRRFNLDMVTREAQLKKELKRAKKAEKKAQKLAREGI